MLAMADSNDPGVGIIPGASGAAGAGLSLIPLRKSANELMFENFARASGVTLNGVGDGKLFKGKTGAGGVVRSLLGRGVEVAGLSRVSGWMEPP